MFLVASCGGEPEASSRNRTLNSVTCYQTQAEKDDALAAAEEALAAAQPPLITQDTTPTLTDASPADAGQLAFIGPMQWWKRVPRASDTTIPATTTVAPTTTTTTTDAPTTTTTTTTVAASTTVAESTTTVAESTTTTEPAVRTLNPPSNVQASADGSSVNVSWSAPEASNTPVEAYNLIWSPDGWRSIGSWRVNGTSATVPNWAPGTTVQFQVRADNDTYRVYSGFSNVASATIASPAVEETTTTVAEDQSSDEETDTTVATVDVVDLVELQAQVNIIEETPLCADVEAAAEIQCAVLAGFSPTSPDLAAILPCPEADEVRVQYEGGYGSGIVAGAAFQIYVGAGDRYVFQVARAGVVIASGTVERGGRNLFTGIDQASLFTPDPIEEEETEDAAAVEAIECDATAGLDLNLGLAWVDPCDAATGVQITFDGASSGALESVSGGSRASVSNPDELGFTFVVYVGESVAVSGSVAYPTEPAMVTRESPCDVSVTDQGSTFAIVGCDRVTRIVLAAYNAGQNSSWGNTYNASQISLRKWLPQSRYNFTFFAGADQVASLVVNDGESASGTGTIEEQIYADVESEFSGSVESVVDDSGEEDPDGDDGTGDLEPRDGYVVCTAITTLGSASFECSRPISAMLFVRAIPNDPNPTWLWGDENTFLGPLEEVHNSYLLVTSRATGDVVLELDSYYLGGLGEAAEHQFYVPDVDVPEEEYFDEEEWPYFEGTLESNFPSDTLLSFTVPDDYSASGIELVFGAPCEEQAFGAVLVDQDDVVLAQFEEFEPCAVGLFEEFEDPTEIQGQSYGVVLYEINPDSTPWEGSIEWWGSVEIQGEMVSSFGTDDEGDEESEEEEDSDIEWGEPYITELAAPIFFEFEIGAGGQYFEFRGNSLQFEDWECPMVDPLLKLHDFEGQLIASDDNGGEPSEWGQRSALIRGHLSEGQYYLTASTWDFENPEDEEVCADAQTTYQGFVRFGTRVVIVEEEDPTGVTTTTTTTTTTTVPPTEESTEEATEESTTTTTTTTTVPATTTTTVPPAQGSDEPVITPLSEPPANLQPDPPTVTLPVQELQVVVPDDVSADNAPVETESSAQPTLASIGIPSSVDELVCNGECVDLLLAEAGVDDGAIEIAVGSQSVVIDGAKRGGAVKVRPGARKIVVTVTPSDGSAPVTFSRDIVVMSPRNTPTKIAETARLAVSTKVPQPSRLPFVLAIVGAIVVLAGVGSVRARRGKGQAAA